MSNFQLIGVFVTLIAAFGFLNQRFLRLPDTLGITAIGVAASILLAVFGRQLPAVTNWAERLANSVDFTEVVFHGMLGMLLFAGSLTVDLQRLQRYRWPIFALATFGVVLSTFALGGAAWGAFQLMGLPMPLLYCLLFGALISPTDPIAVLGVLKKSGVSEALKSKIIGESLFNDATAVVAFVVILGLATGATQPDAVSVVTMLARELLGGLLLGAACGFTAVAAFRGLTGYPVKILVTLALPTGGYAMAEALHVSAPLAVVVMGLVVGHHGSRHALSSEARAHVFGFWELMDEVLTLALFGLIGIKLLALDLTFDLFLAGVVVIPLALLARATSVAAPLAIVGLGVPATQTMAALTWGGLRGGISIALALSVPDFPQKPMLLVITYAVVLFGLLVQAPTLPWVLRKARASSPAGGDSSSQQPA